MLDTSFFTPLSDFNSAHSRLLLTDGRLETTAQLILEAASHALACHLPLLVVSDAPPLPPSPAVPFVSVSHPDDFDALTAARGAPLVTAPWSVFALHLRLLEESDLELLPMPELVLLEGIPAGLATLRERMGFVFSLAGLHRLSSQLARRIQAPHAATVRAALERFSLALRAHASSPPPCPFPATEALGLALSLEAGTLKGNLLPRALGGPPQRAYLLQRCQLMAQRLRRLALDEEFFELRLTPRPHEDVLLRVLRREVGAALATGILDHVSSVIATCPNSVTLEAALSTALELGMRQPEVVQLKDASSPELRPAA